MNDAFLKFVWQYLRFDQRNLCTQTGEKIEILSSGKPNASTGPDFLNATVRIGRDLWKGSIVVHVDGDDWYEQDHNTDEDFSNVILNVCFRNVNPISNLAGHRIPSLELNGKIPVELIQYYEELLQSRSVLACQDHLLDLDELTLFALRDRLITERLELRSVEIFRILEEVKWDWDKAFYTLLVRNFGGGAASINFRKLADILNFDLLADKRKSVFSVEALLFGQSGMLDGEFTDSYPKTLQEEYNDLRMAYDLESMDLQDWKCKGCEHGNEVALRIAQLAWLISDNSSAFHHFVDHPEPWKLLEGLKHSFYWDNHFDLDQTGPVNDKNTPGTFIQTLLIDVFTPAIYAYGKSMAVPDICIHAVEVLNDLEPEVNRKTDLFASIGLACNNAVDSQAASHLMNCYCTNKRCLNCPVGRKILGGYDEEISSFAISDYDYLFN